MKRYTLKRIFSIFLLISFVSPFWISYFSTQIQKNKIKREIKRSIIAGIDKSELVLLKFSHDEIMSKLKWEHSKEFEFKGEMYDIVESELKGDTIWYWCWLDNEETELNKKLYTLVNKTVNENPNNIENNNRLTKLLDSLFTPKEITRANDKIEKSISSSNQYLLTYISAKISPPTPPPRILIS